MVRRFNGYARSGPLLLAKDPLLVRLSYDAASNGRRS